MTNKLKRTKTMKNILLLTLIIPALSACSVAGIAVGTSVEVLETEVDLVTENDTGEQTEKDTALAFTEE